MESYSHYLLIVDDSRLLMVYFDDLRWRAIGTVGYDTPYQRENDTGPDDAVHSEIGVFSLHVPEQDTSREVFVEIYDFLPTVLKYFGVEGVPLRGKPII